MSDNLAGILGTAGIVGLGLFAYWQSRGTMNVDPFDRRICSTCGHSRDAHSHFTNSSHCSGRTGFRRCSCERYRAALWGVGGLK